MNNNKERIVELLSESQIQFLHYVGIRVEYRDGHQVAYNDRAHRAENMVNTVLDALSDMIAKMREELRGGK